MALREMADQVFTWRPDIGKYPYAGVAIGYHKAMRLYSVVMFGKAVIFKLPICRCK
jgi:hypothetical protein